MRVEGALRGESKHHSIFYFSLPGAKFDLGTWSVHYTPGHAPNHLCFLLEEERVLFTGDNVLEGMFSVINPARGGDMHASPEYRRHLAEVIARRTIEAAVERGKARAEH